jgi:hypothetical protein
MILALVAACVFITPDEREARRCSVADAPDDADGDGTCDA